MRSLEGLVAIADEPTDDEDLRLRKRVGVVAGYATILAPLSLPIQAQGHPASIVLGVAMSLFSIVNLVVLARDRRFDPYVSASVTRPEPQPASSTRSFPRRGSRSRTSRPQRCCGSAIRSYAAASQSRVVS
jgi:hypothetical protein